MEEISKLISENNKKKPTQKDMDELFDVLREEGLTEPIKKKQDKSNEDQVARPFEPEPQL